jgi:hypothetical protein
MTIAIIGLRHTKIRPKTFYDDLNYWVGPTKFRPKSSYYDNNYWAKSNQNNWAQLNIKWTKFNL